MGGGRDQGVEVKYLLVIRGRLRGRGGGKQPHAGSLQGCEGILSGTAAPCRCAFGVFGVFAQRLPVLFRPSPRARCSTRLPGVAVRPAGLRSSF